MLSYLDLLLVFSVLGTLDACIKSNKERFCCDRAPKGGCPDVDCSCEDPDHIFCTIFGCDSVYASKCKKCYVQHPPPPSPPPTAPPIPYVCIVGGPYCNFEFCCPSDKCKTSSKCAGTTPTSDISDTTPATTSPITPAQTSHTTPDKTSPSTPGRSPTTPDTTSPVTPDTTSPVTPNTTSPMTPDTTSPVTPDTTSPTPKCAYNGYLTTVRVQGGSRATKCLEAPGYVSIKIPLDPPLPFCGGILLAENQIQTSEFCIKQLVEFSNILGGFGTVDIYDFNDEKISNITDFNDANGVLTLDSPVTFSAANCLLPACVANDTSVLDLSACKVYGSGVIDGSTLQSDGTQVIPVSITGPCDNSINWCTDPASTVQTCAGDAGGPLICPDDMGQYLVAGLTFQGSGGTGCSGPPEFIGF